MNILVIGNGFDLAHELPTTYQDFLKFTDNYRTFLETEYYEQMLEVKKLVDNNVWIQHFKRFYQGNGWIDFEKEISNVIQIIDKKIPEFEKMRDKGTGCVKFNFREQDTLKINGKTKCFGSFTDEDEAGRVALQKAKEYGKTI